MKEKVVGFTPCFFDSLDNHLVFRANKKIFSLCSGLRLLQNRILICSSPFSFHSQILIKQGVPQKTIVDTMLQKIDEICQKEGIKFSLFPFVSEFEKPLVDKLQYYDYVKLHSKKALYLDIKWSCFEDYLKSFNANTRRNIKREIENFKKNKVIIEEIPEFKEFAKIFSELYSNLFSKYNKDVNHVYTAAFFSNLNEYAKDKTKVFVAKRIGKIVGFCLCLRQNDTVDCFICGF